MFYSDGKGSVRATRQSQTFEYLNLDAFQGEKRTGKIE